MRITFSVTAADIRLGKREDSNACPIARSVKRGLRPLGLKGARARTLEVFYDSVTVKTPDTWGYAHLANLPTGAGNFLDEFDGKEPVDPFSFCLDFKKSDLERAGLTIPKEA